MPRTTIPTLGRGMSPFGIVLAGAWLTLMHPGAGGADEWPARAESMQVSEPGVALATEAAHAAAAPHVVADDRPSPRTLAEFVSYAERNHPRLIAARAAVEAARGKAVQARLYPNPMAAAGSPQIAGPESQWSYFVTQDVVTAGKLKLAQQAALRGVQQAEYDLIRARYDVLAGVRQSFYSLLVTQRRVEIYRLLLDIAKRSYEIGDALAK
ncbi:MAG: TolC family protein, partial [Pirellulales bacterium]